MGEIGTNSIVDKARTSGDRTGTPVVDQRVVIIDKSGIFFNLNKVFPHIGRPLVLWPNESWQKMGTCNRQ
jgi:hypothetical protein